MPEPAIAVRPDPLELWRLNLPGLAVVRCLVFQQAGVWGAALKVNNQTDDVREFATREEAVRQAEAWRTTVADRVLDREIQRPLPPES